MRIFMRTWWEIITFPRSLIVWSLKWGKNNKGMTEWMRERKSINWEIPGNASDNPSMPNQNVSYPSWPCHSLNVSDDKQAGKKGKRDGVALHFFLHGIIIKLIARLWITSNLNVNGHNDILMLLRFWAFSLRRRKKKPMHQCPKGRRRGKNKVEKGDDGVKKPTST